MTEQEAINKFGSVVHMTEDGTKRIEDMTRDELLECIRSLMAELQQYRPKWEGC